MAKRPPTIPDSELEFAFARSSGPGGQNVNKVSSKAILRWNVATSKALPPEVRERVLAKYRKRVTGAGELIVSSQRFRDQGRNVTDALDKLRLMLIEAARRPKVRRPTSPTRAALARRIESKQARSRKKQMRRGVDAD